MYILVKLIKKFAIKSPIQRKEKLKQKIENNFNKKREFFLEIN